MTKLTLSDLIVRGYAYFRNEVDIYHLCEPLLADNLLSTIETFDINDGTIYGRICSDSINYKYTLDKCKSYMNKNDYIKLIIEEII